MTCLPRYLCTILGNFSLEALAETGRQLQSWAWAESTRGNLNSQQKIFLDFCRETKITTFPVGGETLIQYAAWLVFSGRVHAVGSLKQYLSAVSTLHRMFGLTCHTLSTYGPLKFTVVGLQRRWSRPTKKMEPITGEILYNLLAYPLLTNIVCDDTADLMITVRAFYVVAYFSMLRASNLVLTRENKVDLLMVLTWGAIRGFEDGVVINMRRSKTNQHQERVHQVARPGLTAPSSVPSRPWSGS